ncbi:MAG: hypothetical protein B7Z66_06710 [Chromatiales bacterium 21-64-14]|nr:MAG: hypothetical protein B7Z66_06710 [Chromatiales bacterium 21-64-14]HQU16674.1 hypothetical protein [Gammaproteobacteria bacterium]
MTSRRLALLVILALVAGRAAAVDSVTFSMAQLAGSGWQARDVRVSLAPVGHGQADLSVSITALTLPGGLPVLRNVAIRCTGAALDATGVRCDDAHAELTAPGVLPGSFPVRFQYRRATGAVTVTIPRLRLTAGALRLAGRWTPSGWSLDLAARALDAAPLVTTLRRFGVPTGAFKATGRVALNASLAGDAGGVRALRARVSGTRLTVTEPTGRYASEGLGASIRLDARRRHAAWQGSAGVRLIRGQLYVDPLYLQVPDRPITAHGRFRWRPGQALVFSDLALEHPGLLSARGDVRLGLTGGVHLRAVALSHVRLELGAAYPVYLQPFLYGTAFDGLVPHGEIRGRVRYRDGALRALALTLAGVNLSDPRGRFGLQDATGTVQWTLGAAPVHSALAWRSAALYRIPIGAAALTFTSRAGTLALDREARIPVLDGALLVNDLQVDRPGSPAMSWQFAAVLTPVSLEGLTRTLGWTPFSGKLSGMIPQVRYQDHQVRVNGVLLVRVFGGDITVRDLRLTRPFGRVPALSADVAIRNLDLQTLTRTFSFGKMEGRLSGRVAGLQLDNWKPVRFDARLATPSDDGSRHRISQKALKNLTRIGGGGVGGLVTGILFRVFHEFSYQRLGLSCRLRQDVCEMGGIGPAPGGGYYIVKGGGLPRISVVGFAHQVDWDALVAQLRSVTREAAGAAGP